MRGLEIRTMEAFIKTYDVDGLEAYIRNNPAALGILKAEASHALYLALRFSYTKTNKCLPITKCLLNLGINPDTCVSDEYGHPTTPILHYVAEIPELSEILLLLLEKGANKDLESYGSTPFLEAANSGNLAALQTLAKASANIHIRTSEGLTAADCAARHQKFACLRYLHEDLHIALTDQESIHIVADSNKFSTELFAYMIGQGLDVNYKSSRDGQTALHIVLKRLHRMLICQADGENLHELIAEHCTRAKFLLSLGAKTNIPNSEHITAQNLLDDLPRQYRDLIMAESPSVYQPGPAQIAFMERHGADNGKTCRLP
ncbi:MAG: hypothetical protein K0R66_681 [Gammaproteobacteria bacterium]|jgi:ankyrin repeat protein|nr:hypothetical protein [Gammaproteobacteria bacterium]